MGSCPSKSLQQKAPPRPSRPVAPPQPALSLASSSAWTPSACVPESRTRPSALPTGLARTQVHTPSSNHRGIHRKLLLPCLPRRQKPDGVPGRKPRTTAGHGRDNAPHPREGSRGTRHHRPSDHTPRARSPRHGAPNGKTPRPDSRDLLSNVPPLTGRAIRPIWQLRRDHSPVNQSETLKVKALRRKQLYIQLALDAEAHERFRALFGSGRSARASALTNLAFTLNQPDHEYAEIHGGYVQ